MNDTEGGENMNRKKILSMALALAVAFTSAVALPSVTANAATKPSVSQTLAQAGVLYFEKYNDGTTGVLKQKSKVRTETFSNTPFTAEYVGPEAVTWSVQAKGMKKAYVSQVKNSKNPVGWGFDNKPIQDKIDAAEDAADQVYAAAMASATTPAERIAASKAQTAAYKEAEKLNDYHSAEFVFYATKAKKYTATITATLSSGAKLTKKVTVYAGPKDDPVASMKLDKTKLVDVSEKIKKNTKTTTESSTLGAYGCYADKESGKLSLKANGQYELTGAVVVTVNNKNKLTYTKLSKKQVKKGKKITLSKGYVRNDVVNLITDSYTNNSQVKETYVFVSYKDKITGETVKKSIDKKSKGYTTIKTVTKEADGTKDTSYSALPSADYVIYQY